MSYIIESKTIILSNGYSIEFEYEIKKALTIKEIVIIVVDPPFDGVYNKNVFAISLTGDFLWRIGDVKLYYWGDTNCPYIGAILNDDDELVLFNWCDTAVIVQPETGEVIRTYQTK